MSNSVSSNVIYSNEIFKHYLMELSTGIVWKNTSRANENDSSDLTDIYLSELFVVANRGLLNFSVVKAFPRSVLLNAGIPEAKIEEYASDKLKIPLSLRKDVVAEYEKALTSKDPMSGQPAYYNNITKKYEKVYVESNNYYRMLMGLPNREDTNFIYNTDPRWDTTTPIHLLPLIDRLEMEQEGILGKLLAENPSKEYITYLGKKNIDPFKARIADRFEILYQNDIASDGMNRDFTDSYNNARQLVLSVYYNKSMRKTNVLYENFMAMSILFMAINSMLYKYLQVDITRDFYDTESLKLVYDSYSVPFFNEIPLEYHRKIVKNINKLISYKGSSKVFFDLFDIFDLGSMDIYSYFLTKTHVLDKDGNPLFIVKKDANGNELRDAEGNPILDSKNYDIKFSRVKIYDDPALSISDKANDVEYEYLTVPDPYWIEDADLIEKLGNEKFNYLESKYIGIQTIFDLMKITYENAYIFRLITDNKNATEKMIFRWSDIGINCSIFDLFIYLASLYCRHYGYAGLINGNIPAIMDTLGYNFSESSSYFYNKINNDPYLKKNTNLLNTLKKINLSNLNSVNENYNYIITIRDIIMDGYINATTIPEYRAYKELYNSLMISKEITDVYTNPKTGEIYETFSDVLSDCSPELMQRFLLLSDDNIEDEILIAINQLEKMITSLRYLELSSGIGSNSMIDSLFRILKFFKSAKAELVGYNIIYTVTMRGVNYFKMLDMLFMSSTDYAENDSTYFNDFLMIMKDSIKERNELISIVEEIDNLNYKYIIDDYIDTLCDMIIFGMTYINHRFSEYSWYIDFLNESFQVVNIADMLVFDDKDEISLVKLIDDGKMIIQDRFRDNVNIMKDILIVLKNDEDVTIIIDSISFIAKLYRIIEIINNKNDIKSKLKFTDKIIIKELNKIANDITVSDDIIKYIANIILTNNDILVLFDSILQQNINKLHYRDIFNLFDKICVAINNNATMISVIKFKDNIKFYNYNKYSDKIKYFLDAFYGLFTDNSTYFDNTITIDSDTNISDTLSLNENSMLSEVLYEYSSDGKLQPIS